MNASIPGFSRWPRSAAGGGIRGLLGKSQESRTVVLFQFNEVFLDHLDLAGEREQGAQNFRLSGGMAQGADLGVHLGHNVRERVTVAAQLGNSFMRAHALQRHPQSSEAGRQGDNLAGDWEVSGVGNQAWGSAVTGGSAAPVSSWG